MKRSLLACAALLALMVPPAQTPALALDLPLGDGKVSSTPKRGYIYSCQSRFNGRGANGPTPWIKNNAWDPDDKPTVDGHLVWPNASITITREGEERVIRANSLPDHATGQFPIARSDDAYRFDRNPNSIREQSVLLTLPATPQMAQAPSCLGMGMIGFALTGTAIFNGLDAVGRDAPAHEIQDSCNGHPQERGQYHYHNASPCMKDTHGETGGHSDLVGYALDGFGIYGTRGEDGVELTSGALDACHGHTHTVTWDGKAQSLYHYHLTLDYPYTLGCFKGTPVQTRLSGGPEGRSGGSDGRRPPRRGGPPPFGMGPDGFGPPDF